MIDEVLTKEAREEGAWPEDGGDEGEHHLDKEIEIERDIRYGNKRI